MMSRRTLLAVFAGSALLASVAIGSHFKSALLRSHSRLRHRSKLVQTSSGVLEYAEAGAGAPLLMIHGTGGGFDQGLLFARRLISLGHRVIAPSRFGYLRSAFPADPSSEQQADAFVQLLDQLGIDRIAVAGGSAGALSAGQFALRHPDRCSALTLLVPAANVRGHDPVEMSPAQQFIFQRLLNSDFAYWALLKLSSDWLIRTLLATDPALVKSASTTEQARVREILGTMLPISARTKGMINDGLLAGNPANIDFASIKAPTLIISAEDDRFGTADTARHLAAIIPNTKLVIYPTGGHVWVEHDADVAEQIANHIAANKSLIATKAKATELSATP